MTESVVRTVYYGDISTHILTKRMTIKTVKIAKSRDISTHILTKRMTSGREDNNLGRKCISTHILTKRMTAFTVFGIVSFTFQLTSSRRG